VANTESNFVSVIDTATNTVGTEIEEQCSNEDCHPSGLAITPNGRFLYVANRGTRENPGNTVSVIATATNEVVATVTVDGGPQEMAITPDGGRLYVMDFFSDGNVSVIDTAKALTDPGAAVIKTIQLGRMPLDVVISPDGGLAFISSCGTPCDFSAFSVTVVDTNTNAAQTTVPADAAFLSVTPDGGFLYGTNLTADSALVIDAGKVLTDPSHAVTKTIPVGGTPFGPAISADGRFVYVPNCGEFCISDEPSQASSISVIDTTVNEVATTLQLPATSGPAAVAFTPDGAFAYVTYAAADTVAVVDTAKVFADPTHAVIKEIEVAGPRPAAIAIASLPMCIGGHPTCVGDCGVDRQVTVDEILAMVNIALGNADVSGCQAGDVNGGGEITVDEILTAVNNALNGC
jgi:YVTN family beta-propeller protein